jgi:sugar lactone lactonase YvrE
MKKHILYLTFLFTITIFKGQNHVTTYAGNGTSGLINGDTSAASFKNPFGMCIDKFNNIYVADGGNNCIRKISFNSVVTTLAGTGVAGFLDGLAASAQFNSPTGVCIDDSGNVYVADFLNHRIRKISNAGSVTTIAGSGTPGFLDGASGSARFNYPRGICRNKKGSIFVGDSWNHRIRKISPAGIVSTYAGGGAAMGVGSIGAYNNGQDTAARFFTPAGLGIDRIGNVYSADAYNHRIRKIDTARLVTTIAGSGPTGIGSGGFLNGPVTGAILNTPTELYIDSTGKIYIGDTFNNRVRLLSSGSLSTFAGSGMAGYINGPDTAAKFNYPRGVVCNTTGNKVYIADYTNNVIRKVDIGSAVGIKESKGNAEKLSIYPNPANGKINIRLEGFQTSIVNIKITDVLGKEYIYPDFNLLNGLELNNLNSGIYTLSVFSAELNFRKIFVKQ